MTQFFDWCTARKIHELDQIRPVVIAGYIEELAATRSAPTIKQHLAAIRMLFDWLVTGQVVPMNPASSVRGPKYVVKKGKTPVLKADEARTLLDSIDTDTIVAAHQLARAGRRRLDYPEPALLRPQHHHPGVQADGLEVASWPPLPCPPC